MSVFYIKCTCMEKLPKSCDYCIYYTCRPHPYKGWTQSCELCLQSMDDDQEEGWVYDGDSRPKNCPLVDVANTPIYML